jgi:hypothetical protein
MRDLQYIQDDLFDRLNMQLEELVRIINGYIAYLERAKHGENEPGANCSVRESAAGGYFVEDNTNLSFPEDS